MDDSIMHELLERYLAGECTPAEGARVEHWLEADADRQAYAASIRELGETWKAARPRFESQAAWRRTMERIAPVEGAVAAVQPEERPAVALGAALRMPSGRTVVGRWIAAAVVAAAALGVVMVNWRQGSVEAVSPATREYATAAGQQMSITLPDGTRLWIAPRSRLRVDGDYGRATRTVELEGQAYFQVTHDEARPFRVRARGTVAWDLGTKFTVRAYPNERVRVAVEEGSVAVPLALDAPLLPGDLATIDERGKGTVEHDALLARYVGWTGGTLDFSDTPLAEAAADLSRWYGVRVVLGDSALARRHITVAIADPSLVAALDLVAPAVGARYVRAGDTVTLYSLTTR